jgi:hypothetical protein
MAVDLDRAGAVGAAELGVVVDEGFGDGLEFPEGFVSAADFEAAALDLTLVDFFGFGGHDVLLGGACSVMGDCLNLISAEKRDYPKG